MKKIMLLFIVLVSLPFGVAAQVTAIKAGKLVDPETGTTLTNQVILVEGRRSLLSATSSPFQRARRSLIYPA